MSKKVITAADTGSVLTYDREGNVVNDCSKETHLWDAMRREYKKCAYCKKWYLLSSFPESDSKRSKDGHSAFCSECAKKQANRKDVDPSQSENKPTPDTDTEEKAEVTDKQEENLTEDTKDKQLKILSLLPDEVLIEELRRRGFEGSLTIFKEYEL